MFHIVLLLPLSKGFLCGSHTFRRKTTPILAQAQGEQLQFPAWLWSPEAGAGHRKAVEILSKATVAP